MPPASRGCRPPWLLRKPLSTSRDFHRTVGLRDRASPGQASRYAAARTATARTTTQTQTTLLQRLKAAVEALQAWIPGNALVRQIQRIPPRYRRFIGTTLKLTPIFLLVGLHFPYQIMSVNGSSMSPFLNPNNASHLPETKDKILIKRLTIQAIGAWGFSKEKENARQPLQRGEIIVFYTPHDPTKVAVKRIVAVAGDKVTPLVGYNGPAEEVIHHNHLWVEGDVNDREKSRDSNWYGQISESLVIGRVVALMQPWWRPNWIEVKEHTYPAKRKGRVLEDAVMEEKEDIDSQALRKVWSSGLGQELVTLFKQQRSATMNRVIESQAARDQVANYYAAAVRERMRNDPSTSRVSGEMVETLASIFDEMGFIIVQDEQEKVSLLPTEEAQKQIEEFRRTGGDAKLTPEEKLEKERMSGEIRYLKAQKDVEGFDSWWFWNRYNPKSVISKRVAKSKQKWEEKQRQAEEDLRQSQEKDKVNQSHLPGGRR